MTRLLVVPMCLALATICMAQRSTWIVDQAMGPGAHYRDINTALAKAADGDRILVRKGSYSGFVLTRGVAIIGLPGAVVDGRNTTPWQPIEVHGVPTGRDVRISGLQLQYVGVLITNCAGRVLFDRVTFDMWLSARSCKQLSFTRCSNFNLGLDLAFDSSSIVISEGTGLKSLDLKASNLTLVHTSMRGLLGYWWYNQWYPAPSVITTDATSTVTITGDGSALIRGGSTTYPTIGGSGYLVLDPRVQLGSYEINGGLISPAIKLTKRTVPYLDAQGAPLGGTVNVTLKAGGNHPFFLAIGLPGNITAFPSLGGSVWLDLKTAILVANGNLDKNGGYTWSTLVPQDNVLLGLALVWQGTAGPSLNQQWLSNPSAYVHGL